MYFNTTSASKWAFLGGITDQMIAGVLTGKTATELTEQLSLFQLLTDTLGISNYQETIQALSKLTGSTNNRQLENNIRKVQALIAPEERQAFEEQFSLRMTEEGGNSTATLFLADIRLTSFECEGTLELDERVLTEKNKGNYKLTELKEDEFCVQLIRDVIVNPQTETIQNEAKRYLSETMRMDRPEGSPVDTAPIDLRRAVEHLPAGGTTTNSAVITAEEYVKRIENLLKDLIDHNLLTIEKTIKKNGNEFKFILPDDTTKLVAEFDKIFWSPRITDEDRAFLMVLTNQAFNSSINRPAMANLISETDPHNNSVDKKVLRADPCVCSFSVLPDKDSGKVKMHVSTLLNFREVDFAALDDATVLAHRDISAIYTLSFDINKKEMHVGLDITQMDLFLHDKAGKPLKICEIHNGTVHPELYEYEMVSQDRLISDLEINMYMW